MKWQQINGIPFKSKDTEELTKQVNRFNRKLKRIKRKYENEDIMLPDKLSVKQLKQDILTRKDLRNFYKSVDRFMRKDSEEIVTLQSGIQMTKYQRKEISINMRKAKSNLKKMMTKFEELKTDTKNPTLNFARFRFKTEEKERLETTLQSLKNVETRDRQGLSRLMERINRYSTETGIHKKNLLYKENYLKALKRTYATYGQDFVNLYERLSNVNVDDFYTMIADDDIVSDIEQFYVNDVNQMEVGDDDSWAYFKKVELAWEKHLSV